MEDKQTIQELWALPIKMEDTSYDFYGHKLYSSDKLKLKFFEAVLATDWGKFHAKNIQRLMKQEYIVPVIMNKGILGYLAKKFILKNWTNNVQGLFSPNLNKVLVFIDNNSNWFGVSSNDHLVKTTLHECMHLSASRNINGFFKIMKPTFEKYYGTYFSDIFQCKTINATNIVKTLLKMEGWYSNNIQKNYMNTVREATEKTSKLDNNEYNEIFQDLFTVTKVLPLSPNLLLRFYPRYFHIFRPLDTAYTKTFGERNKYTTVAQELWAFSEVASVMVELLPTDGRVAKVLSNIK